MRILIAIVASCFVACECNTGMMNLKQQLMCIGGHIDGCNKNCSMLEPASSRQSVMSCLQQNEKDLGNDVFECLKNANVNINESCPNIASGAKTIFNPTQATSAATAGSQAVQCMAKCLDADFHHCSMGCTASVDQNLANAVQACMPKFAQVSTAIQHCLMGTTASSG